MIRVSVALVFRNSISLLLVSAALLAWAPTARGVESSYEDLRLSLRADSRLIFIGGAGNPVTLVLGSEDKSACLDPNSPDCHPQCNAIDNGDGYGVTLRVFKDRRWPSDPNTPDDRAPFRLCNGAECAGTTTPVTDTNLSQEDGVARIAVKSVDLPEGACVTTQPTDSFFFAFKKLCDANLDATISGHRTALPDPNTTSCQGAFEDAGFGSFGEAVFADPTGPNPDDFKNIPLLTDNPSATFEAQQNGLRLKLPLVGVQKKFGGIGTFTAEIELAFQITTGLVGGQNIPVPNTSQRIIPLGSGSNGAPVGGVPLDRAAGTIRAAGAVATSTNPQNTPPNLYNIWGSSIAFLDLDADVTALTDPNVPSALREVFPDADLDGVVNAMDSDDDNDGILDDGTIGGVGSAQMPHTATACETVADPSSTPGECLQGSFEASYLASQCGSKSAVTNSLDADTDDDGLADGSHDKWTLPGDPVRVGEDTDFDGCLDAGETKPTVFDTDYDSIGDGRESSVESTDLDDVLRVGTRTLTSYVALSIPAFVADADPNTSTNPLDADSDDDGLPDGAHPAWLLRVPPPCLDGEDLDKNGRVDSGETNPNNSDSDVGGPDGLLDGREVQLSLASLNEQLVTGVPFLPAVSRTPEFIAANITVSDPNAAKCTDPLDRDTDDDGFIDGFEVNTPYVAFEPALGAFTDPVDADTDDDLFCDGGNSVGAPASCAAGDNCPLISNNDQINTDKNIVPDGDALGDACDPDDDADGVLDTNDNCPLVPNSDQLNTDGDLLGNACDLDDDNDGITDVPDLSPLNPDVCADADADTCDDCAVGTDNFGALADNLVANDGTDTDADGACNLGDTDDDNDGVTDVPDLSPLNPDVCADADADTCDDCAVGTDNFGALADNLVANDGTDTDADGACNLGDTDDDNDGVTDVPDLSPLNPDICADADADTCDDCAVGTDDFGALADNLVANDGTDTDADGACNLGDTDDDNDGVTDVPDLSPLNPDVCADADADTCDDCAVGTDDFGALADNLVANDGTDTDADGACNLGDTDDDNDGVTDVPDLSPLNPDICADADADTCDDCAVGTDDFGALADNLVANDGTDTDADGACNLGDTDDDNDGVTDVPDLSPLNPDVCADADADTCDDCAVGTDDFGALADNLVANDGTDTDADGGCDLGDLDDDDDGVDDIADNCPLNSNAPILPAVTQLDSDADDIGDACDNCAYALNTDQSDAGGVFASGADGIGDACQCGDVSDAAHAGPDYGVNTSDIAEVRLFLVGASTLPASEIVERCSVDGVTGACTVLDWVLLARAQAYDDPSILTQVCRPANCLVDPSDLDGDCQLGVEDLCLGWANNAGDQTMDTNGDTVPDTCQCGDLDRDGDVDQVDRARLIACIAGQSTCDASLADLNRDGSIDSLDDAAFAAAGDNAEALAQLGCTRRLGPNNPL